MKYMLMLYGSQQDYDTLAGKPSDKRAWSEQDVARMHAFMGSINKELMDSGEWVDGQGLSAPVHTRRVQLQHGVPVVTDGPYAETEEVIAGFWIVECESFDRATEIAAKIAHCPTPDGKGDLVDVRPVDGGEDL